MLKISFCTTSGGRHTWSSKEMVHLFSLLYIIHLVCSAALLNFLMQPSPWLLVLASYLLHGPASAAITLGGTIQATWLLSIASWWSSRRLDFNSLCQASGWGKQVLGTMSLEVPAWSEPSGSPICIDLQWSHFGSGHVWVLHACSCYALSPTIWLQS